VNIDEKFESIIQSSLAKSLDAVTVEPEKTEPVQQQQEFNDPYQEEVEQEVNEPVINQPKDKPIEDKKTGSFKNKINTLI
jgi:hypothetical protein